LVGGAAGTGRDSAAFLAAFPAGTGRDPGRERGKEAGGKEAAAGRRLPGTVSYRCRAEV